MKILLFSNNYPSLHNPRPGIMVKEFAESVRHLGIDLRVVHIDEQLCFPLNNLKRYRVDAYDVSGTESDPEWVSRFKVTAWPVAYGISWRAKRWSKKLMKHVESVWPGYKPDIIHSRTFIPCAIAGEGLTMKWGCPMVISSHGVDTRYFINRRLTRRDILSLSKKQYSIVCVSEHIYKTLLENGAYEKNLRLIYNGMDISKVYQGENPLNGKYNDKFLIVGVGNLQPYKGFDILIDAIAQLHKTHPIVHGVIVGSGQERLRLKKNIRQKGLESVVELTGAMSPEKTMEYMAASKVFCLPSWSEGFGIVYLEAMAQGKPVIAVKGQGIDSIVRKYSTGLLVEPKNVQSLVVALKELIKNESMRDEMGERGKKLIQKRFTWTYCAQKYIALYQEVFLNQVSHRTKV